MLSKSSPPHKTMGTYAEPASPGLNSRGKPFIIRLVKCPNAPPMPINVSNKKT